MTAKLDVHDPEFSMVVTDVYPPVLPGSEFAVDAVYVLSVKTYVERIAHVRRELGRHGIASELILDFDADDIEPDTVVRHFVAAAAPMRRHMSLTLKHMEAWRRAVAHGHRRILVFEDDVILHRQFHAGLATVSRAADALAPGWLIFLGGADTKVPDWFFLHPGPLVPMVNATTEGYLTDLDACRRRLDWCDRNKIAEPADQLLARIDRETGIAQYWPTEALVEQGSVTGLFNSVLDSSRMKHSHIYNVARHRWTKWRRRTLRKHWVLATRAWRRG